MFSLPPPPRLTLRWSSLSSQKRGKGVLNCGASEHGSVDLSLTPFGQTMLAPAMQPRLPSGTARMMTHLVRVAVQNPGLD